MSCIEEGIGVMDRLVYMVVDLMGRALVLLIVLCVCIVSLLIVMVVTLLIVNLVWNVNLLQL
jgi:hypothetical protein